MLTLFLNHFSPVNQPGEVWFGAALAGDMMAYDLDNESLIVQGGSFMACEENVNIDMG